MRHGAFGSKKIFTLIVQYLINTNSNIGSVKGFVRFLLLDNIRNVYFELNSIRSLFIVLWQLSYQSALKNVKIGVFFLVNSNINDGRE